MIVNKNLKFVWLGVFVSLLVFFVLYRLANQHVAEVRSVLNEQEQAYETQVFQMAETMRANRRNVSTDTFFQECNSTKQNRFDSLLSQLSNPMNQADLSELLILLDECAYSGVHQKFVLALRLLLEVEAWQKFNKLNNHVSKKLFDKPNEDIKLWLEFADNEIQKANNGKLLVRLQGNIIAELLTGSSTRSPEILEILAEVDQVKLQINEYNIQNNTIFQQLTKTE